jgi:hypothetical protein
MDPKEKNLLKIIKKMKLADFIYLGVIFLFFTITIILFSNSTSFVLKNVNKIFLPNTEVNIQALDMARYSLIQKKLNLPVNSPSDNTVKNLTPLKP